MKFSVSPRRYGSIRAKEISAQKMMMKPNRSFTEKYGWNGILLTFDIIPSGLFDPD